MRDVRALFFDVGGTIFDWKSTAKERIEEYAAHTNSRIDANAFAEDWRSEMFKIHGRVRVGDLPWMNADAMHLKALDTLISDYPLLEHIDRSELVRSTWHALKTFPGAAEAVERLRSRYTVIVLTILSWESIVQSSKAGGVQWDGILSCEFLSYYKPSLQAYLRAAGLLGLEPAEAMMVAAHAGDVSAAQAAGLRTALVSVPEKDVVSEGFGVRGEESFDIEARDFEELCSRLGVSA